MKKMLLALALVSIAFTSESFAKEQDHIPKVEKFSKASFETPAIAVELQYVAPEISIEKETILVPAVSLAAPDLPAEKSVEQKEAEPFTPDVTPRIRDKDERLR